MDNSLQQVVSSLNDGVPSEDILVDELLNADPTSNPYQERRRGAQRQPTFNDQLQREKRLMTFGAGGNNINNEDYQVDHTQDYVGDRRQYKPYLNLLKEDDYNEDYQDEFNDSNNQRPVDGSFDRVEVLRENFKLLEVFVQSPTNMASTQAAQINNTSQYSSQHVSGIQEDFDSQFEIMDPKAKGFQRLINPDDRTKLRNINQMIGAFLEDITTEENDMQYGYISGANTIKVSTSAGEFGASPLFQNSRLPISNNLMQAMAGGVRTLVAQQMSDEIRTFSQKLIERKRNGLGKMGISASGSINVSATSNILGGSGPSGSLANGEHQQLDTYRHSTTGGINDFKHEDYFDDETKHNAGRLLDKKKTMVGNTGTLKGNGGAVNQDQSSIGMYSDQQVKEDLLIKPEWLRIKKKIGSVLEMHPLTLNIDNIFNLPNNIKVVPQGQSENEVPEEQYNPKEFLELRKLKKLEIRQSLHQLQTQQHDQKSHQDLDHLVQELFTDKMEFESHVCARDHFFPQYQGSGMPHQYLEPSQNSVQFGEVQDPADINFYRDLNPYMRRFNHRKPLEAPKVRRKIQKYLYYNHFGSEIDQGHLNPQNPSQFLQTGNSSQTQSLANAQSQQQQQALGQGNFTEEMYLLGLSNLVPTNKYLKRLAKINSRWDCSQEDPVVQQYLEQESDIEENGTSAQLQNETRIQDQLDGDDTTANQVSINHEGSLNRSRVDSSINQTNKQSAKSLSDNQVQERFVLPQKLFQRPTKLSILQQHPSIQESIQEESKTASQKSHTLDDDDSDDEEDDNGENDEDEDESSQNSENEGSKAGNDVKSNLKQSPLTRMVSNANLEMSQHLAEIERLRGQLKELDEEVQAMQQFKALKKDVKRHEEYAQRRNELRKQVELHINEMIEVLDTNATYNSDADGSDGEAPTQKSPTQAFVIKTETIIKASLIRQDEEIDEALKARFLARLFREYRRNLEHQNRVQRRDQRQKDITQKINNQFPVLGTDAMSPNESLLINHQLKNHNQSYNSNRSIAQEERKRMLHDNSPNPKLNIPSSDSTLNGKQNTGKNPPLRQRAPQNEVNLFEIEEISHPPYQQSSGRGRQSAMQQKQKNQSERIIMLPQQQQNSSNNLRKPVNSKPTYLGRDNYNQTINGVPLKPPANSKKINHFAKQSTVKGQMISQSHKQIISNQPVSAFDDQSEENLFSQKNRMPQQVPKQRVIQAPTTTTSQGKIKQGQGKKASPPRGKPISPKIGKKSFAKKGLKKNLPSHMRPKHQDLPPEASDEEQLNNQMALGSEDDNIGDWISGGASERLNQVRSNGGAASNNYQRMIIAPQSNSSGVDRPQQNFNEDHQNYEEFKEGHRFMLDEAQHYNDYLTFDQSQIRRQSTNPYQNHQYYGEYDDYYYDDQQINYNQQWQGGGAGAEPNSTLDLTSPGMVMSSGEETLNMGGGAGTRQYTQQYQY